MDRWKKNLLTTTYNTLNASEQSMARYLLQYPLIRLIVVYKTCHGEADALQTLLVLTQLTPDNTNTG